MKNFIFTDSENIKNNVCLYKKMVKHFSEAVNKTETVYITSWDERYYPDVYEKTTFVYQNLLSMKRFDGFRKFWCDCINEAYIEQLFGVSFIVFSLSMSTLLLWGHLYLIVFVIPVIIDLVLVAIRILSLVYLDSIYYKEMKKLSQEFIKKKEEYESKFVCI
jgi:hypothetical protein